MIMHKGQITHIRDDTLMRRRNRFGYFFIFPLIIGVLFIFIPNLFQTVRFSLSDIVVTGSGYNLDYKGFTYYYEALFENSEFLPKLVDNIRSLAITLPVLLIYSLFISTILNQKFFGRVVARILFFIPVILAAGIMSDMNGEVMGIVGAGQAIDVGLSDTSSNFASLNTLLSSLNFPAFLTRIITDSIGGIYHIATRSGLQIFIFLAGLQEIPQPLYEAASIEGCSKWELFWKITFPMISPQIAVNMVYTIADTCANDNVLMDFTRNLAFNQNQYALSTSMNFIYLICLGVVVALALGSVRKLTPHMA